MMWCVQMMLIDFYATMCIIILSASPRNMASNLCLCMCPSSRQLMRQFRCILLLPFLKLLLAWTRQQLVSRSMVVWCNQRCKMVWSLVSLFLLYKECVQGRVGNMEYMHQVQEDNCVWWHFWTLFCTFSRKKILLFIDKYIPRWFRIHVLTNYLWENMKFQSFKILIMANPEISIIYCCYSM